MQRARCWGNCCSSLVVFRPLRSVLLPCNNDVPSLLPALSFPFSSSLHPPCSTPLPFAPHLNDQKVGPKYWLTPLQHKLRALPSARLWPAFPLAWWESSSSSSSTGSWRRAAPVWRSCCPGTRSSWSTARTWRRRPGTTWSSWSGHARTASNSPSRSRPWTT